MAYPQILGHASFYNCMNQFLIMNLCSHPSFSIHILSVSQFNRQVKLAEELKI